MTRACATRLVVAASVGLLAGCGGSTVAPFPAPAPTPSVAPGSLRGGAARVDLTPPVGLGLLGYGPEGKRAAGWRQRLYARALVLEDASGDRLALVTVDLAHVSWLLALRVAERTGRVGIGADRLLLSATHTHSGPAHFHGIKYYDDFGSSVGGYDPGVVEFLAERIAAAVVGAAGGMRAARAAWGADSVWGCTRIRSDTAFKQNPPAEEPLPDDEQMRCGGTDHRYRLVDPTLTMLRVDLLDSATSSFRPAAAYTVFAIHGTVNSVANDLYDADVHGVIARGIERPAGSGAGATPPVHLVANGASGDVSPDLFLDRRCRAHVVEPDRRPRGPRAPRAGYVWWRVEKEAEYRICRARDVDELRRIGAPLAERAAALYERLGARLSKESEAWSIGRAAGRLGFEEACHEPRVGGPTAVGAEDGRTRLKPRGRRWKVLGLLDLGFDTLAVARSRRAGDCQYPKHPGLGLVARTFGGRGALPDSAALLVATFGPRTLVALPFEVTTTSGRRIRDSAAVALSRPVQAVTLLGLANGYNSYLATEEEYGVQAYEGASTLYGPRTQLIVAREVARQARQLLAPGAAAGDDAETTFVRLPRPVRRLEEASVGPGAAPRLRSLEWRVDSARSAATTVVLVDPQLRVEWDGEDASGYVPAGRATLQVEREVGGAWRVETWDDDLATEVRSLGGRRWQALWRPRDPVPGRCRVRIIGRAGAPDLVSAPLDCSPPVPRQ
ncbi:MAG: neutral/alkaline non-lysosomal ceramidase N-terminal domain-containing protein [Gemmatimonadales bacterium]